MKLNKILNQISDLDIKENIDLSRYTTIKLFKMGNLVIVKTIESLQLTIKKLLQKNIKYQMLGWGANQVLINTENTVFIKLDFLQDKDYLNSVRDEYTLPASFPLNLLTSHGMKFGLKGWDVFTGIPASLGGAIFMNAGTTLGEIGSLVKSVKILSRSGEIKLINIDNKSFSYRKNHFLNEGEVIIEATLTHFGIDESLKTKIKEYLELRKRTQPLATRNCGCVFKNFDELHKAGQFIDACGLKGFSHAGLRVSHLHANFIENVENAKAEDFIVLVEAIKYELELFSGIEFELEAKVY